MARAEDRAMTPLALYRAAMAQGTLAPDPAQAEAVGQLDRLAQTVVDYLKNGQGFRLSRLFSGKSPPPRGLYLWGGVGRGKTMLMDLFYDAVPVAKKRRVHFHAFMSEVHDAINAARKTVDGDPIPSVGEALAERTQLLCFDEFHVTDIADAMILGRLFDALFSRGVVVVATSNVPPERLYWNGLNRDLVLPFIDRLQERMEVLELVASKDYRLEKLRGQPLYFTPISDGSWQKLRDAFKRLTGVEEGQPVTLDVKGRAVTFREAAGRVLYATFAELCDAALGPNDYLAIAQAFDTVIIEAVPLLDPEKRNAARRLTTLIDALYDQRVSVILSAAAEPDELCPEGDAAFLFERTASRLMEMRSESYLASRAERGIAAKAQDGRGHAA
jgi:cell division protein ZapE